MERRVALDRSLGLPASVATWLTWAAFGIGYLGLIAWPFDLFANFRVQYLAVFCACALALLVARRYGTAFVALLGAAAISATVAPYLVRTEQASAEQTFRIVTFNVWLRNDDRERLVDFLRASDADVVILQELHRADVERIARRLPDYAYRTATPDLPRVLAIFSRWPLRAEHMRLPGRGPTRIARASIDWQGTEIVLFGAHLSWPLSPSQSRARTAQLASIASQARAEHAPVLAAGDFNLTPWSQHFDRFVKRSGLTDCALAQGLLLTWPAQFWPLRIRIDHCFASRHWRVLRLEVGPKLGSDHLPVVADLELIADGR